VVLGEVSPEDLTVMTSEAASNKQQAEIKRGRRVLLLAWKKKQIGDHALPQRGFGLGTPKGRKEGGQRERAQATCIAEDLRRLF
jgi:hypothetical protein